MPQRRHAPDLKLLHGVDPNELVDPRPVPATREPTPPANLTPTERRVWNWVVNELRDMGTLASADGEEIAAYARIVAMTERIHGELQTARSLVSRSEQTGVMHAHPLIATFDRAVGRAHALATSLGLNPHGRSVIHGHTTTKPDTEAAQIKDLYA